MGQVITAHSGWSYDRGDPSVGLWPSGWVHEDCEEEDSEASEPTILTVVHEGKGFNRHTTITLEVVCSCGSVSEVTETYYDPEEL